MSTSKKDLAEKKLRYIEHLLTLGGLLAVFLGLALQSTAINRTLIFSGTNFSVAALLTYTVILFRDKPLKTRTEKIVNSVVYSLLAASFSAIVFLAYAYAFTGAGAGDITATIVIVAVLTAVYFVLIAVITKVLSSEDSKQETGPGERMP